MRNNLINFIFLNREKYENMIQDMTKIIRREKNQHLKLNAGLVD